MVFGKVRGKHLAVGAWKNPWRVTENEQIAGRVRALLQDKLITRGGWVELYVPVGVETTDVVACTCVKDTTKSADRECLTCYGNAFAPGFLKFLHQTLFWCSAETSDFTSMSNTSIVRTIKANRVGIANGQTTATIITQDKAFTNPQSLDWEVKLEAYVMTATDAFMLEYSTDAGDTWTEVTLTRDTSIGGTGFTGTIDGADLAEEGDVRFRVTMTAATAVAAGRTPLFEIVRLRRMRRENENFDFYFPRKKDFRPGHILVLKPWLQEQDSLEEGRGRLVDHIDRTWTCPLDFFDSSITTDTPACRIDDTLGTHAFYKYTGGVQKATRYVITKTSVSEKLGQFTHQFLDDRKAQKLELPYCSVW